MTNCGISRWDDPREINARLKELTDQPIWEVSDEYYNSVVLPYYEEKCKASRAVYEEAQKYIPGGVQHNLAFNKPFPMCMSKAEGAYLYDKVRFLHLDMRTVTQHHLAQIGGCFRRVDGAVKPVAIQQR